MMRFAMNEEKNRGVYPNPSEIESQQFPINQSVVAGRRVRKQRYCVKPPPNGQKASVAHGIPAYVARKLGNGVPTPTCGLQGCCPAAAKGWPKLFFFPVCFEFSRRIPAIEPRARQAFPVLVPTPIGTHIDNSLLGSYQLACTSPRRPSSNHTYGPPSQRTLQNPPNPSDKRNRKAKMSALGTPRFCASPLRYIRWASREKPAYFWSVVIGSMGPVLLVVGPPIRKRMGADIPAEIPMTYPSAF